MPILPKYERQMPKLFHTRSFEQTVKLENAKWRILDKCHKQRNLAEYEGHLEITPQLLEALVSVTEELLKLVEALGPLK